MTSTLFSSTYLTAARLGILQQHFESFGTCALVWHASELCGVFLCFLDARKDGALGEAGSIGGMFGDELCICGLVVNLHCAIDRGELGLELSECQCIPSHQLRYCSARALRNCRWR